MNLELETWDVINSYFRDIPNYLVRHHIDSYNDFINNKIPLIMKNFAKIPPYILIDKDSKSGLIYEIKMYYGGRDNNRYTISKPTIITYPGGEVRQLYPNEARLKNLTYGVDFFYDVDIDFIIKKNGKEVARIPHPNPEILKNIYLGRIPVMLRSDLCVLSKGDGELLRMMGEDKHDPGGYFIMDGAEKVIASQERKAENIIFLNTINDPTETERYTHFAEIKCVSDEAFATARTVKVQLERAGPITVRLGQKNAFLVENNKRDVPLFIMFRALGVESDREILQYIIGSLDGDLAEKMMEILRPSIMDPFIMEGEIYDKTLAEAYLVKLPSRAQSANKSGYSELIKNKVSQLSVLYHTLNESLFPHISSVAGDINIAKAYYLGYITRRLLFLKLGLETDTDRDNFVNKRIDLSGFLMATLFRDSFKQVIRAARVAVDSIYRFNSKDYSGQDNIINIISETTKGQIFNPEIFKRFFNGALKKGKIGEKDGIVQALDRVSRNLTIAHLRKIIDNIAGGRVTIPRRRLHGTQYGCVCPAETPEGPKVGLNKGLAIISHITFGAAARPIIDFLVQQGLDLLDDLNPVELHPLCKVFVNGNWVGCHRDPARLNDIMHLYRQNGLINIFISITWERSTNELRIYTDGGRFVQPLYKVENNNMLIQPRHIKAIQNGDMTFTDLVSGFRPKKTPYDYYDDTVKPLSFIGLDSADQLYIDKLRESQSVIEYIDSCELDTTLISSTFNIAHDSLVSYTHTEIHPSMFLSFNAHLLPFTEHNASARVIFSSKQVKQGISTYAMNYNNRIDTSSQILNYPQLPLTQGRLHGPITQNKYGQGQNVFVALVSYNYNQEDAIVGNQDSVDMGMFHTSHFKQYYDFEMKDPTNGEESHFYNPYYKDEIAAYPQDIIPNSRLNYNLVDKYGFPKVGAIIGEDSIVISKYAKFRDEHGQEINRDMPTTTKLGNEGAVVDRVFSWQTNIDGDRAVKVRVCKNLPPIMGDKFASRCGQKGTFGITMKRHDLPYTEDGIIPDFILDPGSYPKRMTVSQFIEILFGNLACELGFMGTYNAFEIVNIDQINDILETKLGMTSWGDRILYNGKTGEQMDVKIFSGVLHYQRLKYIVSDKINHRIGGRRDEATGIPIPGGLYTVKERQSVAGRANEGGLRIGEMERDALISHGIWGFIKESFIERCDKFIVHVSMKSGEIAIANPQDGIYYDNISDGIASYQLLEGSGTKGITGDSIIGLNTYDQKTMDFVRLVVPYTFKLLIQEMQGMMLSVRFNVSILRDILVGADTHDGIPEITTEMIDDMMDDMVEGFDDNYNEDGEVLYEMEDEMQGGGSGDEYDVPDVAEEGEVEEEGNPAESGEVEEVIPETNPGSMPNLSQPQDPTRPTLTEHSMPTQTTGAQQLPMAQQPIMPGHQQPPIAQQPGAQQPGAQQPGAQQPGAQQPGAQIGGQSGPPLMEVSQSGSGISVEEVDLSAYGGVKPDFNILERDHDKAIEKLNAELLGIQTGGENEMLEQAKTAGIHETLQQPGSGSQSGSGMSNTPFPSAGELRSYNVSGGSQPMQSNQNGGMNFSFQPQRTPQFNQPQNSHIGGGQQGQHVSFNNDIKTVEIDAKIRDGFLYTSSNKLDPFRN